MSLNTRSKEMIQDGAEILREVVARRGAMSLSTAKDELRRSGAYKRVEDITIDRIGILGRGEGFYGYDVNLGFWRVGGTAPPGYIRDLVKDWAEDTTTTAKKKYKVRVSVDSVLSEYNDPTVDQDAACLVQEMTSRVPSESKDLGSFRSFVIWGIQNGRLCGDIRNLMPPPELYRNGLHRGTARAYISLATLSSNTHGQWLWTVTSPSGSQTQMWATLPEMNVHLDTLKEEQVDDEELDLADVFNGLFEKDEDTLMTLDEAIAYADHLAVARKTKDQKQIADWLRELKVLRERIATLL